MIDEGLSPEEAAFLERLRPSGLDWRTPLAALAARHGVRRPYDWEEVVILPAALAPAPWSVFARADWMDLPPSYAFAHFAPTGDARANHAAALAALEPTLGRAEAANVSNALQSRWRFGLFTLTLRAFPPELQRGINALHARAPFLATATHISVETPYAAIFPAPELAEIAALIPDQSLKIEGASPAPPSMRATRRNPAPLREAIAQGQLHAWRSAGSLGISGREDSVVLRAGPLTLERKHPARGPGGAELGAAGVPLLRGPTAASLDGVAQALSAFWGLPLGRVELEDD